MVPELHFREVTNILRRRSRLILTMAALGTTLAGVGGLLIPPQYTAKAQIVIEPHQVGLISGQAAVIAEPEDELIVQTHVTILSSHGHLQRVVDALLEDPEFWTEAPKPQTEHETTVEYLRRSLVGQLSEWWLTVSGGVEDILSRLGATEEPTGPIARRVRTPSRDERRLKLYHELERRLNVYQELHSHVIGVNFTSTSPKKAAMVVNRAVQLYVESKDEEKKASASRELASLGERTTDLKKEVERADAVVQEYRIAHGLADANRTDVIDQQLAEINRELTAAKSDLSERQARLAFVRAQRRSGIGMDALVESLNSPGLVELHSQELTLRQSEAELTTTVGASHPSVRQVRSQLQEVGQRIAQEIDRAVGNLENEAKIANEQVSSIQQRLDTVQGLNTEAQAAEVHLRALEREATATRQVYESLLQRGKELHEQQETVAPEVSVLALAPLPDRPSSPNPILFILPALIAFSMCGSFLAVWLERLDRGLRSERDVNDALGISCIGLVPQLRGMRRTRPHQYLLAKPFAPYTEAIRSVVAALQLAAPQRPPKVILVSSSVPGEGKTTLAVSFAVYVAHLGRHVLLLDLDFRHPAIVRELGGKAERGVLDLLLHDRPAVEVIRRIPALQLDYLPVKRHPIDPLRLFASEQMRCLLRQLRETYDYVIIDSPPLLAITEARLLASMVDKVLFVVKWSSTRRDVAQNAVKLLRSPDFLSTNGIDLASAVVTQVNLKKHARYRYGDVGESFVKYRKYYREDVDDIDLAKINGQTENKI